MEERIIDLEGNISDMNRFYKRKTKDRWTWTSPDSSYRNEMDYIATNNKEASQNLNILNQFNLNTYHRMVKTVIKSIE